MRLGRKGGERTRDSGRKRRAGTIARALSDPPPEHATRLVGKKSPGKVPGLSLREERAPGAETKKAGSSAGPSRFILWWG